MTEEEARKKWCPMARIAQGLYEDAGGVTKFATSVNRTKGGVGIGGTLCIASECMMWVYTRKVSIGDGGEVVKKMGGYCGLVK